HLQRRVGPLAVGRRPFAHGRRIGASRAAGMKSEPSAYLRNEVSEWSGTSAVDAVDGSSAGTCVPWMWGLLRLPRFKGASHADDNDIRFRYPQVGFPGSRR